MNPLKKHYETLTILGGMTVSLVVTCMYLNSRFNNINDRLNVLENRLTKIETVMILRGIMPAEMATHKPKELHADEEKL